MEFSLEQEEESRDQIGYHVFGDINTVYSEIALNMICKDITSNGLFHIVIYFYFFLLKPYIHQRNL